MKTLSLFAIFFVLFNNISSSYKYNLFSFGTKADPKSPIYYNDMKVPKDRYFSPKVYVVGILVHENEEGENTRPYDSFTMYLNRKINLKIDPKFIENGGHVETTNDLSLPIFEVEYGREPLEYLKSSMKTHYNIDCWENNSVGMPNQYGLDLRIEKSDGYPGASIVDYDFENYDPFNEDKQNGPLIGVIQGKSKSNPKFESLTSKPGRNTKNFWDLKHQEGDDRVVPAIYIGYTIGANFNLYVETLGINNSDESKINASTSAFIEYVEVAGVDSVAVHDGGIEASFIKMTMMLDNYEDKSYTEELKANEDAILAKMLKKAPGGAKDLRRQKMYV